MKKILTILLTLTSSMAFSQTSGSDAALQQKAEMLAHRYIIADGHVDLPYRLNVKNFRLTKEFIGIPVQTDDGDFDYVRAKKGGLTAPFMSIYTPSSYQKTGGAKAFADSLIDMVQGIIAALPGKFAPGLSPKQVKKNFKKGLISLPMGMENGAPIEDDLANVAWFQKRGIRYITLTHAKDNQICDSSYDTTHTWNGLSAFGRQVVLEMNEQGIMVDISHVSDSTFWQVAALSKAPFIASHSSCRAFTPGFERNMNDGMIAELGKRGGVIMINFGTSFLDGTISKNRDKMRGEMMAMLDAKGLIRSDDEAKPLIEAFKKQYKEPLFADVSIVADHIDHVVKLAGVDHVGFGSDFDGVGDSLPAGLKDVSTYPNLIAELLKRGYSEKDIEKICYKNLFRVWKKVEKVSRKMNDE
jgi:membrane dipeptidase